MKGIKKLLTGILTATMIMGASLNVCAASIVIDRDGSYVASEDSKAQKYTYYKILSADINSAGTVDHDTGIVSGGSAAYYVDSAAKAKALTDTELFVATKSGDSKWIITLKTEGTSGDDIAKAIGEILKSKDNPFGKGVEVSATGESTTIDNVDPGYYVITSSVGSTLIAQTLGENVNIKEKNTYPTVDKKQKDADKTEYQDGSVNVKVGDVVDYQITVTVPATANKTINVIDTMSAGLTLNAGSIKVGGYTEGTDWSIAKTPAGASFQVDIEATEATKGKSVVITFQATINDQAIVDTGKKNDVEIIYDNYSQKDSVPYDIYKAMLHKFDGTTKENLKGVKFSVYVGSIGDKSTPLNLVKSGDYYVPSTDANASNIVLTGADGNILVRGLDSEKTYWVYEEETLPGYNLPTSDSQRSKQIKTVNDKDSFGENEIAEVENNTGTVLPSTGGIGTTIFYIIGGLLIVAAVVFFVVRRKSDAE